MNEFFYSKLAEGFSSATNKLQLLKHKHTILDIKQLLILIKQNFIVLFEKNILS